jgi:hypothetical protein
MAKSPPPPYPHNTRKLRAIPLHEIPETIIDAPPNTETVTLQCKCGCVYPPPWRQKFVVELAPQVDANGVIAVPSGLPIPCPQCGARNMLTFPSSEPRGNVHLYGDEASGEAKIGFFYVYAFVGINPTTVLIKNSLDAFKRTIRPNHSPNWPLHVWEVRNTRWRAKHDVKLNIAEIDEAFFTFARALAAQPEDRFISATIMPPVKVTESKKQTIEIVRDMTLTAAILSTTEYWTRNCHSVQFTIEAQTLAHIDNQTDYFVEKIGRGLNYYLNFHWLRNGQYVALPTTAPKASTVELEVADFIAFWTRRYLSRFDAGAKSEIPLETFGITYWGCFVKQRFGTHYSVGFPWDYFFPKRGSGGSENQ